MQWDVTDSHGRIVATVDAVSSATARQAVNALKSKGMVFPVRWFVSIRDDNGNGLYSLRVMVRQPGSIGNGFPLIDSIQADSVDSAFNGLQCRWKDKLELLSVDSVEFQSID